MLKEIFFQTQQYYILLTSSLNRFLTEDLVGKKDIQGFINNIKHGYTCEVNYYLNKFLIRLKHGKRDGNTEISKKIRNSKNCVRPVQSGGKSKSKSKQKSKTSKKIMKGSRGGKYYLTKSKRKVYV